MPKPQLQRTNVYYVGLPQRPLPHPMRAHETLIYLLSLGLAAFIGVRLGAWTSSWLFPEPTLMQFLPLVVMALGCMMLTEYITYRLPPEDLTERNRRVAEAAEEKSNAER